MSTLLDELVILLGFDLKPDTTQKIKKVEKAIDAIHGVAVLAAEAIAAATASIAFFTYQATTSAAALDKYNELTGTGAEEIQKWGFAAEQAGGSARSVKSDIEGLLLAMNPVMPGEYNQGLFLLGMYGQKYKDTTELMLALSAKLKGKSPIEQMAWAHKAGVSNDTLLLLRKDAGEIKRLMAETPFMMSEAQTASARKFEAQINRIKYGMLAMGELVITKTLPTITKLVDKFEHWTTKNKELVSSKLADFVTGITDGISRFIDRLGGMDSVLTKVMNFFSFIFGILSDPKLVSDGVVTLLWSIVGVTTILATKWVLIGGSIALAVLALKDFIDTSNGMKDTMSNKILNWVNDKPESMLNQAERFEQTKRISEREAALNKPGQDKSTLLKVWDGMMNAISSSPSIPTQAANNTTQSKSETTVNIPIQVNGAQSPFDTGQEIRQQLGTIRWGDIAAPAR